MTTSERPDGAAGDSLIFFGATAGAVACGLVSGVVTARVLGPGERGLYSIVVLLVGLAVPFGTLGIGDAAMFEIRSRNRNPSTVAGATLAAVLVTALGAAGLLAVALIATLDGPGRALVLAAISALVVGTLNTALAPVLVAVGGSRASSLSFLVTSAGATGAVTCWLLLFNGDLVSAVLAGTIGGAAGGVVVLVALQRRGVGIRPSLDFPYVGRALRYGVPVQAGLLLTSLTGRVDLLVVYALLGTNAAGQYSVSLTMGTMGAVAGSAVSYGAFPHMASAAPGTAAALVQRALRGGMAATFVLLPPLIVGALGIPVFFGRDYEAAVAPAVVLVLAGAVHGILFLSARLAAARNHPGVLPAASASYLAVMLGADLMLVPAWGILGAALAALLGAGVGAAVALCALARLVPGSVTAAVLPGTDDVLQILRLPLTIVGPVVRRRA